jgi:hypothetical protein
MSPLVLVGAILGLAAFYVLGPTLGNEFRKARGKRMVTCPETNRPAAVELDAPHVALASAFGHVDLRLSACSRWPERRGCGQECLRQIEAAPGGCLVRNVVAEWYAGKTCALCAHAFGAIQTWGRQLALMSPDGRTTEWGEVRVEDLADVLETHRPVCWNCHVAESFRRQFPSLVIDSPPRTRGSAAHAG